MKTCLLIVALMIGGRRAHACDAGGSKSLPSSAIAFGAVYAGTTVAFGVGDLAVRDHSENYAGAEVAFNTIAALAWGAYGMSSNASEGWRFTAAGLVVLHSALLIHGVYTLSDIRTGHDLPFTGPPGMFRVGSVKAAVAPVPIENGAALGLSGVF